MALNSGHQDRGCKFLLDPIQTEVSPRPPILVLTQVALLDPKEEADDAPPQKAPVIPPLKPKDNVQSGQHNGLELPLLQLHPQQHLLEVQSHRHDQPPPPKQPNRLEESPLPLPPLLL